MTLISNACLYSATPVSGWIVVNPVDLSNGLTAFQNAETGPNLNKYASARAEGTITWQDSPSTNESFEVSNGLGKVIIGEGPRVIKVA